MNTIVNFAAPQSCQRALTPVHALPTTWLDELAPQGALRLRDEHLAGFVGLVEVAAGAAAVQAATAHATTAHAVKAAAAVARIKGSVAWSPPPC